VACCLRASSLARFVACTAKALQWSRLVRTGLLRPVLLAPRTVLQAFRCCAWYQHDEGRPSFRTHVAAGLTRFVCAGNNPVAFLVAVIALRYCVEHQLHLFLALNEIELHHQPLSCWCSASTVVDCSRPFTRTSNLSSKAGQQLRCGAADECDTRAHNEAPASQSHIVDGREWGINQTRKCPICCSGCAEYFPADCCIMCRA